MEKIKEVFNRIIESNFVKNRKEAFISSFNFLNKIYLFFEKRSKITLSIIFTFSIIWQITIVWNIISNESILYFLDPTYSIFLIMKVLFLIFLTILLFTIFIFVINLLPFYISSIFLFSPIFSFFWNNELIIYILMFLYFFINIFYYFFYYYKKELILFLIILTVLISILFWFKEIGIFKNKKTDVILYSDSIWNIEWILEFYNWKFYFIKVNDKIEIINDKFIYKVEFKKQD